MTMRTEQAKRFEAILAGVDKNLNTIKIGEPCDKPRREYYPLKVIRYYEPLPHHFEIYESGILKFSCATLEMAAEYWRNEVKPDIEAWAYSYSSGKPKYFCYQNGKQIAHGDRVMSQEFADALEEVKCEPII